MNFLHWIPIVLYFLAAVLAAGHALLFKSDSRAALGWIVVCLMFPLLGPLLYFLFGINRIRTRARKLKHRFPFPFGAVTAEFDLPDAMVEPVTPELSISTEFSEIVRISSAVTNRPTLAGNTIELLQNGEEAYPAMLEAVLKSQHSLFLSTYIFQTDKTGRQFIDALAHAARRGVDVRVIVDGIGEMYDFPRAGTLLKKHGVRLARFLPPKLIPPTLHINLRNHRKILVADGQVGFIGGMNIGDRHLAAVLKNPRRVVDMHFRLAGPVVKQFEQVFLEDWGFCTGEPMRFDTITPVAAGGAICRTVADGPNEDHDKLSTIMFGAVSMARRKISIMTPYFLPSRELIAALQNAALRDVDVCILLPAKNNLPFVQWATSKMLWQLLQKGVRIYYQPPPFVHSKLFIVDDHYAQIGSANVDPRSLRLNFELALEVFGKPVSEVLAPHFHQSMMRSREILLEEVDARSVPVRIRDGLAWLFSPYL
jgi:cardiolipin synthase A/B